jgi:putative ABC transport system permease protein
VVQTVYPRKERLMSLGYPVDGLKGEGAAALAEQVSQVPGVSVATPRIKFGALVSRGEKLEGVLGMGLDLGAEEKASHLSRFLREGRLPQPGRSELLVGQRLLNKLGLKVGSKVTVVANSAYGSLQGRTFTVTGSLVSGLTQLDESSLFMPLSTAQRFVELDDAATELIVMADDPAKVPQVSAAVAELVKAGDPEGRYTVVPWYEANSLMSMMIVARKIYDWVYALIVLFASFVVVNTMLMIVNERVREIGMLGALGFTGLQIVTLLVLEGAALGLLGSAVGVVLGSILTKWLSLTGLDLSKAVAGMGKELLFPSRLYPSFGWGIVAFALLLGILIPALGTLMPARRAQKLRPSEALRA